MAKEKQIDRQGITVIPMATHVAASVSVSAQKGKSLALKPFKTMVPVNQQVLAPLSLKEMKQLLQPFEKSFV